MQVFLNILRVLTYPYSCSLCRHPELSGMQSRNGSIWRNGLQLAGLPPAVSDGPSWSSHSTIQRDYFSEETLASRRDSLYDVSNIDSLDVTTHLRKLGHHQVHEAQTPSIL